MPEKDTTPAESRSAEWELLTADTDVTSTRRMRVPGGWLYREILDVCDGDGNAVAVALCFVPDPEATP